MAKLEGVKTLDMVNGEITKVEYNGEVYEKVETPKKGDIGLFTEESWVAHTNPGLNFTEIINVRDSGNSVDVCEEHGGGWFTEYLTYFRKPSAPYLKAGDIIRMLRDCSCGGFSAGDTFAVITVEDDYAAFVDKDGDRRFIGFEDDTRYEVVTEEPSELFAKVNRPNNVPIPGDYVEFRDDIAEECSSFLTVGKKYEVERVDAFGGADITDDNGHYESAEPYETKAIYVKYTQEQAEREPEVGDKVLVVNPHRISTDYVEGDILTVRKLNPHNDVKDDGHFYSEESIVHLNYDEVIVLNPEQIGEATEGEPEAEEEPEVAESPKKAPFEVGQFVVEEGSGRYTLTIPDAGALEVVEVDDLVMGDDIRVKFHREFKGKYGVVAEVGYTYTVNSEHFRLATDEEIVEALGLNEIKEGDKVEVLAENHPLLSKGATFTVTDVDENVVIGDGVCVAFTHNGKPRIKLVEEGEKQPEIKPGDYVINHRGTLGRVDEIRDGVHYLGEWLYKEEYPDKYPYGMSTFDAVKRLATPEEIAEYEAYKEKQDEQVTNPETIEEGDLVRVIDSPGALPDGSVFKVTRVDEDGTLYGTTEYETSTTQYIYEPKRVELVAKEVDVYV